MGHSRLPQQWYCAATVLGIVALAGCRMIELEPGYETVQATPHRDSRKAQRLTQEAVDLIEQSDLDGAEQKLQKALVADVTYGPAHNNLGRIHFQRRQLYLAAWEFEYSSQLMPGRAEPLNNLGLVFEAVDRQRDAIAYYQQAYELEPHNPLVISNLARARVRSGEVTPESHQLLNDVALRDDRPEWREWALEELATGHVSMVDTDTVSLTTAEEFFPSPMEPTPASMLNVGPSLQGPNPQPPAGSNSSNQTRDPFSKE